MKNIVIGLTGYPKVGKTTAADYLCKEYKFQKCSLTKFISETVNVLGDTISKIQDGSDSKLSNEEIIHMVRYKGVKVSPDFWINIALFEMAKKAERIVIDDLSAWEAKTKRISVIQIVREPYTEKVLENISTIENNMSVDDLHLCLKYTIGKFIS